MMRMMMAAVGWVWGGVLGNKDWDVFYCEAGESCCLLCMLAST